MGISRATAENISASLPLRASLGNSQLSVPHNIKAGKSVSCANNDFLSKDPIKELFLWLHATKNPFQQVLNLFSFAKEM